MIKKKTIVILIVTVIAVAIPRLAQTRTDSDGNTVYHPFFAVIQNQMVDFEAATSSGSYGLGLMATSISHWGRFHVGANVDFSINAGFVDNWGCLIGSGPSARIDINKYFFVNMPVHAICAVTFPEGTTDTDTSWDAKIAPSIHAFLS